MLEFAGGVTDEAGGVQVTWAGTPTQVIVTGWLYPTIEVTVPLMFAVTPGSVAGGFATPKLKP